MTLTSFIKQPEVKVLFSKYFAKPEFNVRNEIKAKVLTKHPMLIGTAFDYLLRFMIKRLNSAAIEEYWVAEASLALISHNSIWYRKANSIIQKAKDDQNNYLRTGDMNRDVLESAIKLAQLDGIFRSGDAGLFEKVGEVVEEDIEDLTNIISVTPVDVFKAKSACFLNPTFGTASMLVGGADADLVIDDMLIDIKTVKDAKLTTDFFNQLIGYTALIHLGSINDVYAGHNIKNIGIYFSRHGYLHNIAIKTFSEEKHFSAFLKEFERLALRCYGDLRSPSAYNGYLSKKRAK